MSKERTYCRIWKTLEFTEKYIMYFFERLSLSFELSIKTNECSQKHLYRQLFHLMHSFANYMCYLSFHSCFEVPLQRDDFCQIEKVSLLLNGQIHCTKCKKKEPLAHCMFNSLLSLLPVTGLST